MAIWRVVKENLAYSAVYLACGTVSSRIAKQVLIEKTGSLRSSLGMVVPTPVAGVLLAEFSTGLDQALCLFSSDIKPVRTGWLSIKEQEHVLAPESCRVSAKPAHRPTWPCSASLPHGPPQYD